ncbi:MAG: hypothetical protein NVS4B7_14980 [Ktedonobacteraceae bacterium]
MFRIPSGERLPLLTAQGSLLDPQGAVPRAGVMMGTATPITLRPERYPISSPTPNDLFRTFSSS